AGTFLVTCVAGDWPTNMPSILVQVVGVPLIAFWLLLLWAAGESWARSHLPSFTTSLDTLRRGKLGARAGRELLLGWAGGAGLAGTSLLLCAATTVLPGLALRKPAASLPLFGLTENPIHRGM